MKKHVVTLALVMLMAAGVTRATAQQPAQRPAGDRTASEAPRPQGNDEPQKPAVATVIVPLEINVVVSRYQGEKKISSQPYTLNVNATGGTGPMALTPVSMSPMTVVKIGSQVPLPNFAPITGPDGKPIGQMTGGGPVVFKEIGTQIDCRAKALEDGRFEIQLGVQDTSVLPAGESGTRETVNLPVLKTFQATNNLVLRDGQSRQFVAATDPASGQQVKVDVTLKVVK